MLNFQDNAVAIIDSGIGGISILNQMIEHKISNQYIYFADNLYMPYGNKSKEFIKERILEIIKYLRTKYNVKYIVLACNTASSCVKDEELENIFTLDFNKDDIYLATKLTASNLNGYKVIPCNKLATQIEKHIQNESKIDKIIKNVVRRNSLDKLNSVTLGCTHYELVADKFREYCKTTEIKLNSENLVDKLKCMISKSEKQLEKPEIKIIVSKFSKKYINKIVKLIKN